MRSSPKISLHELVLSISHALDLVDPAMSHHHQRVAYTALRMAERLELKGKEKEDVVVAAALHDIGALSERDRLAAVRLDAGLRHAQLGYRLLGKFKPFREAARIVRFHHVPWEGGQGDRNDGEPVPEASHVVHLADRVDALLDGNGSILHQGRRVRERIGEMRGSSFVPEHVSAFLEVARTESFWLDLDSPFLRDIVTARVPFSTVELDLNGLLDFAGLLAQVIDFRSRYTAAHSSSVAFCAATVAELFGLSERDCKRVRVAGYLHDIGKLAVPVGLLERKAPLSEDDRMIIHTHAYHSYRILSGITGLEDIAAWCGMHHERLDGTGYPFRVAHAAIPLEARVIAVADAFVALREDRPYRDAMSVARTLSTLSGMAARKELDAKVVQVLRGNIEAVERCRNTAATEAGREYGAFVAKLTELDLSAARTAYAAWEERLRAYLDGEDALSGEQLVTHRECALGQWYYAEGIRDFGGIPEISRLEAPHMELHRLIRELVMHHERGEAARSEARYRRVQSLVAEVVMLLHAIEEKACMPDGTPASCAGAEPAPVRASELEA